MGNTIEIVCNDCNYRRVFNLGRKSKKESTFEILKCFSSDLFTTIKQMDAAYDMIDYDYGESICVCRNCSILVSKMILKIKFQNSCEFIPKHFCNKCNTILKVIENFENIKGYSCPECGNFNLSYKNICSWD